MEHKINADSELRLEPWVMRLLETVAGAKDDPLELVRATGMTPHLLNALFPQVGISPDAPEAKALLQAAALNRQRILVADDDVELRGFLKHMLEGDGYEVQLAETGKEALTMIQVQKPDVVMLDIRMPDVSGIDVQERLRQRFDTKDIPVLLMSGVEVAAEQAQAGAFLSKPIKLEELASCLLRFQVEGVKQTASLHTKGDQERQVY